MQTIRLNRKEIKYLVYLIIGIFLLAILFYILANLPKTIEILLTFNTIFLAIFIEALPFLVLGTLASGMVEVFVDPSKVQQLSSRSPIVNALIGSGMGLFFPVCECGVVPLVRRLYQKGMNIPTGVAFLLSAPVINPIVIFSTAAAFGFGRMLFMRIGFTLLIAVVTGLLFTAIQESSEVLVASLESKRCYSKSVHGINTSDSQKETVSAAQKFMQVIRIGIDELFEMSRYLVIGAMLAAGMQAFIPQSILLSIGQGPVISVIVMIGLSVLLSICSTVDSFVALGFVGLFNYGSILAFLLYGPMIDIKSVLMYFQMLKPRAVIYMVITPLILVLLIGISINLFIPW